MTALEEIEYVRTQSWVNRTETVHRTLRLFPVFISPIVWNMCEHLHYESVYSYFEKGCREKVNATIPKGTMGYDQYTVSDTM